MKLRTRGLTIALCLCLMSTVSAQQKSGGSGRPQRGGRGGAVAQMRQFDKDGNLYVAEEEFRETFDASLNALREAYTKLLSLFDADGDQKLNQQEMRTARSFLWTLMGAQRFDADRDFTVTDEEENQAWERLMNGAREYNQFMVDRFDKDGDGKLSPEESDAGRKALGERDGRN